METNRTAEWSSKLLHFLRGKVSIWLLIYTLSNHKSFFQNFMLVEGVIGLNHVWESGRSLKMMHTYKKGCRCQHQNITWPIEFDEICSTLPSHCSTFWRDSFIQKTTSCQQKKKTFLWKKCFEGSGPVKTIQKSCIFSAPYGESNQGPQVSRHNWNLLYKSLLSS